MQPPIYNHHRLPPAAAPIPSVLAGPGAGGGNTRLLELLEAVKTEFESAGAEGGQWRVQRDEYEGKIQQQIGELGLIRQSLYELETTHNKIRQDYEAEIARLRRENETLRAKDASASENGAAAGGGGATPGAGTASERATRDLDLPPKGPAPQLPMPEGVREGMPTGLPGPPLNGQAGGIGGLGLESGDGRSPYPGQPHPHRPTSVPAGSERKGADRERDRDPRDNRSEHHRQSEHHTPTLGPGPAIRDRERDSHRPSLPPMSTTTPGPGASSGVGAGNGAVVQTSPPVLLSDLDPDNVSRELKKEGSDWFAVWSSQSKKILDVGLVHTLNHETVVCCVKFSNDGKFLATGCNRTAQIYDVKTGGKVCVLLDDQTTRSGDLYIRSICFSPDGKFLATGAEDRQIRIWDIKAKRIRHLLQGHMQEIYSLDFSRDGKSLVSGSGDKSARIWDVETGRCIFDLKIEDFIHNEHGPIDAGITSVALSPDGKLVAAGSLDTMVRVWNVATGQQVERLKGHKDSVYSVAFSPDGKSLVSGSLDRTLRVWDLTQTKRAVESQPSGSKDVEKGLGTCQSTLNGHKDYVLSVAISPDGQWVVSGSKDRSIQFWNIATGQAQFMLQGHKNSVISIDLARSGNYLASGSGDCMARIWRYDASA